mmetsp:Transcript_19734/g.61770  ORF Transcript_19734/g.61770 Transcript_19734/m.61770 type:complete len:132 (-) Transcript_19734:163-558(-)
MQTPERPSIRAAGATLQLRMTITNVDPEDYWQWPLGTKLKYVIEARMSGVHRSTPVWSDHSRHGQRRDRVDRYGFDISLEVALEYGQFDVFSFVTGAAVLVTVMSYAKFFVLTVLTEVYRRVGMQHISTLF